MKKEFMLLLINVGSTSTKICLNKGAGILAKGTIRYNSKELIQYKELKDQLSRRYEDLIKFINENNIQLHKVDIVVSRGGYGKPIPAGVYRIDESMVQDGITGKYGKHASALGPAMALSISEEYNIQAVVVDPPTIDEFHPLARISGIPEIERQSAGHPLNQKAAARRFSKEIGKRYEDVSVVVAHMGGGITIGAHQNGRIIDCTHGLAEGPFTPERAGSLPTIKLFDLVHSRKLTREEIESKLIGKGGFSAYLGTSDALEVERMIKEGDENAKLIYQAMAYQIAKDVGAMAVVLKGKVDAIVLTGGLASSKMLTDLIEERIDFLAQTFIYPGEDEMAALAEGGLKVLLEEEQIKKY
jgi:butyrate kinase